MIAPALPSGTSVQGQARRTSVVPALDGGPRSVAGLCDGEADTGDVPRMRAERGRLQAAGVSTQHAVDAHPHRGVVSGSPIR